jgi:drug/metabolite transporter (DMT)-like permease
MENSEENIKLYSKAGLIIGTILCTPIMGGFLLRRNYINLGRKKDGNNALIYSVVGMIFYIFLFVIIPENITNKIPSIITQLIPAITMILLVEKYHGADLKTHKENNGKNYPAWKPIIISFIIVVFVAMIAFILGDLLSTATNIN